MAEARTREMHPKRVGERLAEARATLKLELEDIAERSRIPLRHLRAIEASEFESLPASTYSVGFAKTFARGLEWKPEYAFGNAFTRARARLPQTARIEAFERYVADPPDGAAPIAIAGALAKLKRYELLSKSSTDLLIGTMEMSKTGKQRMHGAVPGDWSFGHKTGTGQDLAGRTAGYNDVGLLMAPDGRSYAVAVMIGDTPKPIPQRQALMQAVVMAVIASHEGGAQSSLAGRSGGR